MRVGSRVVLLEPAQVQTCNVVPRPTPGGGGPPAGGPVWTSAGPDLQRGSPPGPGRGRAPGRWSRLDQRRPRPARWFPARLRAGARLSPEKAGGKSAGGVAPWTPFFMARSLALARFGVGWRIVPVVGLFRHPSACPDLETFFRKMLFQHIFYSKMRPKSVLGYR